MTANSLDTIPRPLLDRMEVIEIEGYTSGEKLEIARGHLLGKQLKEHGLDKRRVKLRDDAIEALIDGYTREGRRAPARARDWRAVPQGRVPVHRG